jgi:hypothetical protein
VELLLVVLLLAACAAATQALVRIAARAAVLARQRADASRDLTAVWALTSHELAHATAADVGSPATTALDYDRPVGEGPACGVEPTSVVLRASRAWLVRTPGPGRDQLLVREPQHGGQWFRRGIVSVAVANCPDGTPGLRLSTDAPIPAAGMVRIIEPVRLRSYRSQGVYALGIESRIGGATIQPFAGPIAPDGFTVTLLADALSVAISRSPLSPLFLNLPLAPPP